MSRDKLAALFWPDAETERARHALADSVYVLRAELGDDVIAVAADTLAVDPRRLQCDVNDFEDALETGDRERAAALYAAGGPFLDGIHVINSGELERWISAIRDRLSAAYRQALEELASSATKQNDHAAAIGWWRRLAAEDRLNSRVALGLMRALNSGGDRSGALEFAHLHETIVRQELESAPDPAIAAFASSLRTMPQRRALSPIREPSVASASMTQPAKSLDAGRDSGHSGERRRWAWLMVSLSAVVAVAALVLPRTPSLATAVSPRSSKSVASIAVLPLTNLSGSEANESLADGITEEVTTALAKIDRLTVVASTSAFAFKGRRADVGDIAHALRVTHVLEGSLQVTAERFRLTVRLVDGATGRTQWSETYDRRLAELSPVEGELGRAIAKALSIGDSNVTASAKLMRHTTANPVAYDWYVRGRDQQLYRTDSGVLIALDHFAHAVELDSAFAAAYAGLAEAYVSRARAGGTPSVPARVLYAYAESAATKAVRLDDSLAEAHSNLAYVELQRLDLRSAAAHVHRALALDAGDELARELLATLYNWAGRHEDAVTEARRAFDHDRLSPGARAELARALFFAGRDSDALAQLEALRGLQPPLRRVPQLAGAIYLNKHMWRQAITELRVQEQPGAEWTALFARATVLSGDTVATAKVVDELMGRWKAGTAGAFSIAGVYAEQGDLNEAFAWLDRAVADHSLRVQIMDPTFKRLRADPRFLQLQSHIGIPAMVSALIGVAQQRK